MRRLPLIALLVALTVLTALHADPPGEKYAIIIAVRKYKQTELTDLKYTESDADELAVTLRAAGYKRVILMTQKVGAEEPHFTPVAANIREELKGLLARKSPNDSVVVAFSGHGVQYKGEAESYFCPADAKLKDRKTLVSLGEVYKELEACKAGVRLLLVDACRNEPQAEYSKDLDRVQLESVTRPQGVKAPGGVAALFTCSAGEKAYESPKLKRGVFFHYVCEGLRGKAADGKGTVTLGDLANYVQKSVNDHVREEFDANVSQWPDYRPGTTAGAIVMTGPFVASSDSQGRDGPVGNMSPSSQTAVAPNSGSQAPAKGKEVLLNGVVNLLALIDPVRNADAPGWSKDASGVLKSPGGRTNDLGPRLVIPYKSIPATYTLDLAVTRRSEGMSLNLGYLIDDHQTMLVVDGFALDGGRSALEMLDGKPGRNNETTHRGRLLPMNQPRKLAIKVSSNRVQFACDSQSIIDWKGNANRLSLSKGWHVRDSKALFIGVQAQFEISRLTLTPN